MRTHWTTLFKYIISNNISLGHIEDKEKRTKVHKLFREYLSEFETYTKNEEGEKKIVVFLGKELSKNKRKKLGMKLDKAEFPNVKFVLMKGNVYKHI